MALVALAALVVFAGPSRTVALVKLPGMVPLKDSAGTVPLTDCLGGRAAQHRLLHSTLHNSTRARSSLPVIACGCLQQHMRQQT